MSSLVFDRELHLIEEKSQTRERGRECAMQTEEGRLWKYELTATVAKNGELYLPPTSCHFSHQTSQWAVASLRLALLEAAAVAKATTRNKRVSDETIRSS